MNDKISSAPGTVQDDLAFMRDLAERGQRGSITGGSVFVAGGVLYGVQCLFHWAQLKGWIDPPGPVSLLFGQGEPADRAAERDIGRRAGRNAYIAVLSVLWAVPFLVAVSELGPNLAMVAAVGAMGLAEIVRHASCLAYRGLDPRRLGSERNQRALVGQAEALP